MADEIDASVDIDAPAPPATADEPTVESNQPEIPTDGVEALDFSNEEGQPEPSAEEPTLIEWELEDGRKVKVPEDVKDYLLRHSDYSRKTNEVAEARKALEAERAEAAAWRQAEKEQQAHIGRVAYLEDQMARFITLPTGQSVSAKDIDWVAWQQQNPQAATKELARYQVLQQQLSDASRIAEEGRQKYESETKQKRAERLRAVRDYAQANVTGWSDERDKQITDYVVNTIKAPEDEVLNNLSPWMYRVFADALDGHRYHEARRKAKQTSSKQEVEKVEPTKKVGTRKGGTAGGQLSDALPIDAWMERRNKQARA